MYAEKCANALRLRNTQVQFIFKFFGISYYQLRRNLVRSMLINTSVRSANQTTNGTTDDVIVDFDDPEHLPLPEYPKRPDEPLHKRKQR